MDDKDREHQPCQSAPNEGHETVAATAVIISPPEDASAAAAAVQRTSPSPPLPSSSPANPHSDTLPAPISQLLSEVSIEYRRGDGLISSIEEKKAMQERIKQHALQHLAQNQISPTSASAVPLTPADLQAVAPDSTSDVSSASSSTLPPPSSKPSLLRHLSEAAASGLISHTFKDEIKHMLLAPRMHVLSTTRLVRRVSTQNDHESPSVDGHADGVDQTGGQHTTPQTDSSVARASSVDAPHSIAPTSDDSSAALDVTADVPVEVVTHQIDTSGLDVDQCTQLQSEEREAIIAIYGEENVTCEEKMIEEEQQMEAGEDEKEEACHDSEESDADEDEEEDVEDDENEDSNGNDGEDDETVEAKEEAEDDESTVDATLTTSASSSSSAPVRPAPVTQKCSVVSVRVFPYPAQGPERNAVSALIRFTLPPFYPYLRPAFDVMSMGGRDVTAADGVILDSAISQAIQAFYEVEPVPIEMGEDAPPVRLFDLITSAQDFLCEYQAYLEDTAYHAQVAKEKDEGERRERDERERKERVRRLQEEHARAYFEAEKRLHSPTPLDPKARAEMERRKCEEEKKRAELIAKKLLEEEQKQAMSSSSNSDPAAAPINISPADLPRLRQDLIPSADAIMSHIAKQNRPFLNTWAYNEHLLAETYVEEEHTRSAMNRVKTHLTQRLVNIVSPFLLYRFRNLQQHYRSKGIPSEPSIAFHGTQIHRVDSIKQHGLVVPGQKLGSSGQVLDHRTDRGYYGSGIYLSPNLSMAFSYANRILSSTFVCLVLRGRVGRCHFNLGCDRQVGVDSHCDPSGNEWVIFNSAAVLPCYILGPNLAPLRDPPPPPPPPSKTPKTVVTSAEGLSSCSLAGGDVIQYKSMVATSADHSSKPPPSSKSAAKLASLAQKAAAMKKKEAKKKAAMEAAAKPKKTSNRPIKR